MDRARPSLRRLAERIVIVTGASSGIGKATARLFAEEGARLILLDRQGDGLLANLGENGGRAYEVDITDEAKLPGDIDSAARELGGVDGVINAAGIMLVGPTESFSLADWRRTIDVNLTGTFNVVKSALPWLKQRQGATIVNIASAAGLLPNAPGLAAYAASKGGVIALTRALAADLAPDIRVNCVCPGMVMTPMSVGFRSNVGNYALKRIAEPVEIANALLFLTSHESSYVTGAALATDGGRSFH